MTTLVWFKRDLRVDDHAPLAAAAARGAVIPLYIVETEYWQLPDTSRRQWDFVAESLTELNRSLRERCNGLMVRYGSATAVLEALYREQPFSHMESHAETGNDWTYRRDKAVAAWCRERGVVWQEHRQFGVVRGRHDRDHWDLAWQTLMDAPPVQAPTILRPVMAAEPWQLVVPDGIDNRVCSQRQRGGTTAAEALLQSFLDRRVVGYQRRISSPLSAEKGCSRLSPHLAYGTLSLRRLCRRVTLVERSPNTQHRKSGSLRAFRSRLHWHCHFIQKFEDEPELEFRTLHRDLEGLRRAEDDNLEALERWSEGMTGWPLVDACMRALQATGWINFRMRAMLMAVASYHLGLYWRAPALHLARLFTDFEPGIHYPQAQMQSGLTGINALRIYNPVLQSEKFDAEGTFIRRWVPELARVPSPWIHRPWTLGNVQRETFGCMAYPLPLVDHESAARAARDHIARYRREHVSTAETERVLRVHGSRRSPNDRSKRLTSGVEVPGVQLGLF